MFRAYRKHSINRTIQEIRLLNQQYQLNTITFIDDAFTINKYWVYEFCSEIKKLGI